MSTAISPKPIQVQLRKAIEEAVSANWGELMPDNKAGLMQIEYKSGTKDVIEWLKIWSSTKWGFWTLVCEYWMHEHPFGDTGLHFAAGSKSAGLSELLPAIMQHQQMFVPPADLQSRGLIQVYPPGARA
jgi:hypothetical protein